MCGIVAIYSRRGKHTVKLADSVKLLAHRGPNDRGSWVSSCGRFGLGHSRLKIIDLVGGKQPFHGPQGYHCVVNGEFYDYKDIRQQCQKNGYQFESASDSEIILPLYQQYNLNLFDKLRGEFAFAIFDSQKQRLVAARDRFGVKPLYYYEDEEKVIFASEIKAILALGVVAQWNTAYTFANITNFAIDHTQSCFKGIKQVPAGHYVVIDQERTVIRKYWDHDYTHVPSDDQKIDDINIIDEYKSKFYDAIKTRLVADVPVGVYLSGGLDSCSILGVASKIHDRPLTSFSIAFSSETYNEEKQAIEMAALAGSPIHIARVTDKDLIDNFSDAIWHSEFFFINPHGIAKFILSRLVRDKGFKTVLTGEGSDEHLGGYASFRQDYLLDQYPTLEERQKYLDKLVSKNQVSKGLLLSEQKVNVPILEKALGFVPSQWEGIAGSTKIIRSFFHPDLQNSLEMWYGFQSLAPIFKSPAIRGADHLHKSMYVWCKSIFPAYLLNVLGDRMEMAHSVEARVPFLDHHLIEFLQKVPSRLKINGEVEKFIHREATKDVITKTIYNRQKHPFLAPPACMDTHGDMFKFFRDVINDPAFTDLPMFNTEVVRKTVNQMDHLPIDKRQKLDAIITAIVSLTILGQKFKIS